MELFNYKSDHKLGKGTSLYSCDTCCNFFKLKAAKQNHRRIRNVLSLGMDVCVVCSLDMASKKILRLGTEALSKRTKEEKIKNARKGGLASALTPNSGRFSTERWNGMSSEEQSKQVNRANNALQERLNSDPEFKRNHFLKVHKQKGIGYISKGHKELHENIKHLGFKTHEVVGSKEVDELNESLKIIIEYNGDYWHCNPKKYDRDYYNKSIKMTAGRKWKYDASRKLTLNKLGYKLIVVWESEWNEDKEYVLLKINEIYNEAIKEN